MSSRSRPTRVLFVGGKAVGCGVLQQLIESPLAIVSGVIVNPNDTHANRWYPSATEIALANGLPVRMAHNINSDDNIAWIRECKADLMVIAYYDQILAKSVFAIPRMGCVNLHLAPAEKYRGCFPTTWALINGETITGVTLHRVTSEIDGGDILAECEVPIMSDDTGVSLYNKCTAAGVELFGSVLPALLAGQLKGRPQCDTPETRHYNREFPSHEIRFEGDAQSIRDRIRALHFPPFPDPYIIIGDKKLILVEESKLRNSGL